MKSLAVLMQESHQAALILDDEIALEEREETKSLASLLQYLIKNVAICEPYVLSLSDRELDAVDLVALAEFLRKSPQLIYLDLSNCELNFENFEALEAAFIALVSEIKAHAGLRAVDFSELNLTQNGLCSLAGIIRENKNILQFSMAGIKGKFSKEVLATFGKSLNAALEQNQALLAFSALATVLEEGKAKEISEARKNIEDKLAANRRSFLSRVEANPTYLDQYVIPDSVQLFLDSLEFEGSKVDITTLSFLPLKYIKAKQQEELTRPNMVELGSAIKKDSGATSGRENKKQKATLV